MPVCWYPTSESADALWGVLESRTQKRRVFANQFLALLSLVMVVSFYLEIVFSGVLFTSIFVGVIGTPSDSEVFESSILSLAC